MQMTHRWWACVLVVALSIAFPAWAQTSGASIVGTVTDPTGAAIPGATVTVTQTATGVSREVTTNEVGAYRVGPLDPGTYEIRVSAEGFKSKVQSNVVLQVGAILKVDFNLEVGEVTESIEVTAAPPMLQTQEVSVGGVVTNREIDRIPVNGRNYTRLIILMPGTSDIRRSQSRGTVSGTQLISVNGQRNQDNNITLDGVDNNIMMQNSPGGSPPMDAIQEFRVATNNSAEYGRSAGANVNIAIKSGTRDLHGTVYWYVRNDKFDANPYFNNWDKARGVTEGVEKAPFKQNQYGLAVGGPVVLPKIYNGRDSTFWFFSWEGYRRRRTNTYRLTTPTAEMRSGDFSGIADIYDPLTGVVQPDGSVIRQPFPGNRIPADRLNPGMTALIDLLMPLPNQPGQITRNFIRQDTLRNDRDITVLRVDHNLGANDKIFGRWLHQKVGQISPNSNPNRFSESRFDVENLALGWAHILSPTSVLEVRYAYNKPQSPNCGGTYNTTRAEALSMAGITVFDPENICNVVPSFNAVGWFSVGGGGGNDIYDHNHQFVAKMSKMIGGHSLKWGGTFTWRQMNGAWSNPTNGNAQFWDDLTASDDKPGSGNSVATMLLGYPSQILRGLGTPRIWAKQPFTSVFFQDDWRVTSKLTLNLGVRYEAWPWPYDKNDAMGNLLRDYNPETGETTAVLMWAGVNPLTNPYTGEKNSPPFRHGYGRNLMREDWNNFGPRIGIAYQITPKTVIRAGAGVFYNSTFMQEAQDLRKFWPYLPQQRLSVNRGAFPDFLITDPGPSFESTQAIGGWPQEPRKRTPYSQQWNLFIQRQIMADMTLDIGYVGSSNKKQIGYSAWNNAPKPSPEPLGPRRLLASSGFTGNLVGGDNMYNSEYNALEVKVTKRYSHGLQFLANYTYGNCMDNTSHLAGWKMMDQFNRRLDWSRCDYDIRHAFKAGYVYDLPFGRDRAYGQGWHPALDALLGGWGIEGLVQLQTGAPSHVILGKDWANVGWGNQRPNVVADPNRGVERDPERLFNVDAFEWPERYTFGNSGAFTIHDDGRYIFDVSLMKQFRLAEGHRLEFRAEFFNLPNHFNLVNGRYHNMSSKTFGTTRSATTERQIQFALRYRF